MVAQYRHSLLTAKETTKEQDNAYTETPRRYAEPRWRTSAKQRAASAVAWRFRDLFAPRTKKGLPGWVPLPSLRLQAFRLFKAGWTERDLTGAMDEAAKAPWRRERPKTLWFFLGWVKRARARAAAQADQEHDERVRQNALEPRYQDDQIRWEEVFPWLKTRDPDLSLP